MPVTMNSRLSVPSSCPHALPSERSNVAPSDISVVGPVEPRALLPEVLRTPCASVQQGGAMLGVVPVGALTGPTLWHVELVPSCSRASALVSCARVGGLLGSSWAIRLRTAGVYGAAASTVGEAFADGSGAFRLYGMLLGTARGDAAADMPRPSDKAARTAAQDTNAMRRPGRRSLAVRLPEPGMLDFPSHDWRHVLGCALGEFHVTPQLRSRRVSPGPAR